MIERSVSSPVSFPPAATETSVTTRPHFGILFPVLGFLWCAGMTIAALRKLQLHRRFAGIIRRATVSSVKGEATLPILLSDEVSGPMLYGLWRPVILLPGNIAHWSTPEELAAVVRHECVHFKRNDHRVLALEGTLRAILFFQPMFRWVCQRLDIERELVCDAEVLRLGSDPGVYTRTLLNVAQNAVVQPAGVYFSSAAELTERVELLLRPHRTARIVLATLPLILLMPLVSLGFWQATIESFEPVESAWTLRFLPRLPLETPAAKVVLPPLAPLPMPVPEELTQEPALTPTQQPRGIRTSVMVLRGQGVQNEVRVTMGIPHCRLDFPAAYNSSRYNLSGGERQHCTGHRGIVRALGCASGRSHRSHRPPPVVFSCWRSGIPGSLSTTSEGLQAKSSCDGQRCGNTHIVCWIVGLKCRY